MRSRIAKNRINIEMDLMQSGRWKFFSPIIYSQYQYTLPMILKSVSGNLLDVGCGKMPFKKEISESVIAYDGLDNQAFSDQVKYVCDAHDMNLIEDQKYDSAICLEVLEHVYDPLRVLSEINRVLKPQGIIVISIPHLSRLHSVPNDYYRYTKFGISYLLEKSGFHILELQKKGGLLTFIGHQFSTVLLGLFWGVPILKDIFFFVNKWMVTRLCFTLDQKLDNQGFFACGYAIIAKKS